MKGITIHKVTMKLSDTTMKIQDIQIMQAKQLTKQLTCKCLECAGKGDIAHKKIQPQHISQLSQTRVPPRDAQLKGKSSMAYTTTSFKQ
jgi:hypothetical protein